MKKLLLACMLLPVLSANAQTKKVVLEDFTGCWCGWCPEGTVVLEGLKTANATTFFAVASHNGDVLEVADGASIDGDLDVTSYPGGAVDRKKTTGTKIPQGRGTWATAVAGRLANPAIVSVGFAKAVLKTDGTYEADVNVKFTTAPAAGQPVSLTVYLLEDSVKATKATTYEQHNYSSNVQGGATILDPWWHNDNLRKSLNNYAGYDIPATLAVNTTHTQKISFTPDAAWNKKHMKVLAFVSYKVSKTAATADKVEILNAEEMSLKGFNPVSVNEVNNVRINNAYPNPAKTSDNISVEYNTVSNGKVTISVVNAMGQVVATPWSSDEVAGTHTMKFVPANFNLVPGNYVIAISTVDGTFSQKLNVQ